MPVKKSIPAEESAPREIVISRLIDAPRERVFEAMTDPQQVVKWWGPEGFTNTIHRMEVKPGGVWQHTMHGPDGTDYLNQSVFIEIVKPERIVFTNGGGGEDGPGVNFRATWTFEAVGKKTRITGRMLFPTAEMRERVIKEHGAVQGGYQTMGRLQEYLGGKPEFDLVLERLIDAPSALVFKAWTRPEHMSQWFAPKPYRLIVREMDFRPGGRFAMAMRGPDGSDFPFTGIYREIVPPEKISWGGEFTSGPAGQISTVIRFVAEGEKTRLHARQSFHVMTPEIEQATKGARQGWGMTLDQLERYVGEIVSKGGN